MIRLFCTLKHHFLAVIPKACRVMINNLGIITDSCQWKFGSFVYWANHCFKEEGQMNSVLRVKSDKNHTDQARLHFRNKLSKFSSSSLHKTHLVSVTMFHFHYSVSMAKYSSQNFQTKTLNFKGSFKLHRFLQWRAITVRWESITWVSLISNACINW